MSTRTTHSLADSTATASAPSVNEAVAKRRFERDRKQLLSALQKFYSSGEAVREASPNSDAGSEYWCAIEPAVTNYVRALRGYCPQAFEILQDARGSELERASRLREAIVNRKESAGHAQVEQKCYEELDRITLPEAPYVPMEQDAGVLQTADTLRATRIFAHEGKTVRIAPWTDDLIQSHRAIRRFSGYRLSISLDMWRQWQTEVVSLMQFVTAFKEEWERQHPHSREYAVLFSIWAHDEGWAHDEREDGVGAQSTYYEAVQSHFAQIGNLVSQLRVAVKEVDAWLEEEGIWVNTEACSPPGLPGYPLLVDRIAWDEAWIARAKETGDWNTPRELALRGSHVLNWESPIVPSEPTAEAALQWLNMALDGGLAATERLARMDAESAEKDQGGFENDVGKVVRDAYRLLWAVAKEDYPDEYVAPKGEVSVEDGRGHLQKIWGWVKAKLGGRAQSPAADQSGGDAIETKVRPEAKRETEAAEETPAEGEKCGSCESSGGEKKQQKPRRKRRRRKADSPPPLTAKQTEAVQIVGECKGNIAEAARQLGRDPSTVRQHYQAGMGKLGKKAVKHGTTRLPSDRRGQENVSSDDDQRGYA